MSFARGVRRRQEVETRRRALKPMKALYPRGAIREVVVESPPVGRYADFFWTKNLPSGSSMTIKVGGDDGPARCFRVTGLIETWEEEEAE